MSNNQNLISVGDGIFVAQSSLEKMRKESIKEFVKNTFSEQIEKSNLAEDIRAFFDETSQKSFNAAKKDIRGRVYEYTRHTSHGLIASLVNDAIKDAILKNLAEAGLDRVSNALVWQAIESLREAQKIK